VTPPQIELAAFADLLAATLDAGDVGAVQLRLKDVTDDVVKRAAAALLPVCHQRDRPLILNDRPDLAAQVGADGVHIGQEDAPFDAARSFMGPDRIIGVTCHDSIDLAIAAGEAGADYVAFGAFFPSETKEQPKSHADVSLIERWTAMSTVACVAIGGITPENCGNLARAGADFIAASASIWNHPDGPQAAVKAFNEMIAQHSS
jgi:thiamine-phosphate pyrophosphorylase